MNKQNIMISSHTPKEKLQMIFEIDKEKLKKEFPELYYCILEVLDENKVSYSGEYFKNQK